jgi:hypothetical protein
MKVQWLGAALVAIAAELGMALPASAQSPVFVTRNGSFFQDATSPSDAVSPAIDAQAIVAPEATEAAADADAGAAAEDSGPWTLGDLFPSLAANNMYLNGSMVGSFTYNTASPADRYNGPMTWTDRSNEFQLNQMWLNFGKNVDMDNEDQFLDWGGKITTAFGSNYRWYTAAGFEDEWAGNRDHRHYGLALPNMYLEVKTGKVSTKFGRFASPVGYFGIDSSQNLFNQLPYTFQYGEPFTHVGFLSTWQQTEQLTLGAGMVRGWDSWDGSGTANHGVGVIGTANYKFESEAQLAYFGIYSEEPSKLAFNTTTPRYLQSVVFTKNLTERLLYVFQTDFGTQSLAGLGDPVLGVVPGNAYWYGINQYLSWKQNAVVSWVGNFEWFRDDGGFRVGGVLPTDSYQVGGVPASQVRGLPATRYGYDGSFYRLMAGPRFTTGDNLFFRTALAFDWYDGAANNPGNLLPFDDGTKNTQLVLSGDFVLLY